MTHILSETCMSLISERDMRLNNENFHKQKKKPTAVSQNNVFHVLFYCINGIFYY